jgi:hypothetical protein
MIICPTTSPSFWRKIDRTIGLKTPVRPFDLPNFKGQGQQLSSNPNPSELGENRRVQGHSMDARSQRKINPVDQPAMAAGKNEPINRKPERDSNPVIQTCNYNVTHRTQEGRTRGKNQNINHQPMGPKHHQSRYGMQGEEARPTENQRQETQQAPSPSEGWRNKVARFPCALICGCVLLPQGG